MQSPESLIRAFGNERPEIFKAAAMRGVRGLFPTNINPFYAAFGTKHSDLIILSRSGLPIGRVYLVNNKGEVKGFNHTLKRSFQQINQDVSVLFPPLRSAKVCLEVIILDLKFRFNNKK